MAKDNKYRAVEGLLYSYKTLQHRINNADIDIKLEQDSLKKEKLEVEKIKLELTRDKVENMINSLEPDEQNIIRLKYIDKLTWDEVEAKLNKLTARQLIRERNRIINKKLIAYVG